MNPAEGAAGCGQSKGGARGRSGWLNEHLEAGGFEGGAGDSEGADDGGSDAEAGAVGEGGVPGGLEEGDLAGGAGVFDSDGPRHMAIRRLQPHPRFSRRFFLSPSTS